MQSRSAFMIRFQVLMAIIMSLVILVIAIVTVELALQSGSRTARVNAVRDFDRDAALVEERLGRLLDEFAGVAGMGAALPEGAAPVRGDGLAHPDLAFLRRMLADHSHLAAVRLVRTDGSLLEIIRATAAGDDGTSARPAPGTAFIVRALTASAGTWTDRRTGFDRDWRRLSAAAPAQAKSGGAGEDWFLQAMADERIRIGTPTSCPA